MSWFWKHFDENKKDGFSCNRFCWTLYCYILFYCIGDVCLAIWRIQDPIRTFWPQKTSFDHCPWMTLVWPNFIDLIWTKINPSLTDVLIELSPFKTLLRKFSYGILLTCSLLDIMLCSFTLWANLTEEVTPLSCRLTEKIRNISKKSNLCLPVKNDNPSAPIVRSHVSF